MMSYKTDLQSNNTDLQAILDMILSLGLVDAPTVTLIDFTIAGTSYQAEEGMTWAKWCESDYNTGGYYINGEYIYRATSSAEYEVQTASYARVYPTDVIISAHAYYEKGWPL